MAAAEDRPTDSSSAAQALRESEQKYRALFEQSIDGVYLHDFEGRILDVSRAALVQLGYSRDELLRMTIFDFLASGEPREAILGQWRSWQPGVAVTIEGQHRRKDGTLLPVEIHTGKVCFGDKELMLAIVRDVTERQRAEQARGQLEEQLRQAMKMEAVGRLAGGVAHDFNNMLCAISANAELALGALPAAHPLRRSLEAIAEAAERATELTRQLLAFSRKQVIEPRVIDLNEVIAAVRPMLARLLGEDVILRIVPGAQLGHVRLDRTQIEQVLLNLAVNARDAMPGGGELAIETAAVSLDAGQGPAVVERGPGSHVRLVVRDTGLGMDAETRARIFEPFFTTKPPGAGTGLGLATVYGIVEQSGGRIDVASEPEHGTSFAIYFPCVAQTAEAPAPPQAPLPLRGSETILVVEDEPMVRNVAVRILRRCGYEVLAAASGPEAIALAEHRERPIHLLLTDVIMPRMNGRELARRLVALHPELRVLYTSGYAASVIGPHGVLEEGLQFLAKPYSLRTLAARVREVLGQAPERGA